MNDHVTTVLADLARQRGEIDRIVAGLRQLYGIPEPGAQTVTIPAALPPPKPPRSAAPARASKANKATNGPAPAPRHKPGRKGEIGPGTIDGRVLAYLETHPGTHQSADIAAALGCPVVKRVQDSLVRLRARGLIHRPEPRLYQFGADPKGVPNTARDKPAAPAGKGQPKPAGPPKPPAEPDSPVIVLTKAHGSHGIYRDGSLLKCSRCKLVHVREDAFSRPCEG